MGQGERENAVTLSEKIKSLLFAIGRLPSIKGNQDAMASLALVSADFLRFEEVYMKQVGEKNA